MINGLRGIANSQEPKRGKEANMSCKMKLYELARVTNILTIATEIAELRETNSNLAGVVKKKY